MDEQTTLHDAVETGGPFAVWDLLDDDERREAAAAAWKGADRETRAPLELALAKALKFRARSIHRLPAERVVARLVRLAEELPQEVLFQLLFHLHMEARRELLVRFLDGLGLPHDNGVLDLGEDAEPPTAEAVTAAAEPLLADDERATLVYLATLKVADGDFWAGVDPLLERYAADGTLREEGPE